MFVMNKNVHSHDTRQSDHYHVPLFKTRLGLSGLRYNGANVWYKILQLGLANETHEAALAKYPVISIIWQIVINYLQSSNNYVGGSVSLMDWYWRYNSHAPSHQ